MTGAAVGTLSRLAAPTAAEVRFVTSSGERAVQEREELGEVALRGGLVVGGCVGHRVAVGGAREELGAIPDAGVVEYRLDRRDLLGGHAAVVVGVAEKHFSAQLSGAQVRAVGRIADEAAGVKA